MICGYLLCCLHVFGNNLCRRRWDIRYWKLRGEGDGLRKEEFVICKSQGALVGGDCSIHKGV